MYVKYTNSNMYARYGDNVNNEYLEKRLFLCSDKVLSRNFWKVMQRKKVLRQLKEW